ncbi:MAG: phospho-sugar mutase, partial [Clostridia bacterium]|nr:phospho-sugar mutase [Clostridia bacterium]
MNNIFNKWFENANADEDLISELEIMRNDQSKIENAFFRELEFGTGGLRGEIGAGTNRMNIYTVGRATRGLANYLSNKHLNEKCVAFGYDTRNKSHLFAETSAKLLSESGFKVYIFDRPLPTPILSFAVRELKCCAGIMITASHNPSIYNGFKVYGDDGCQITTEAANNIYREISSLDYFDCVPKNELHTNIAKVPTSVYNNFLNKVSELSVCKNIDKNIHIVYTPLNGTGLEPVIDILTQNGFTDVTVVTEQAEPDGNFPTCPYPNPEIPEAMSLGINYAKKQNADILLATDPDC